jgi:hypothetical protein
MPKEKDITKDCMYVGKISHHAPFPSKTDNETKKKEDKNVTETKKLRTKEKP